LIAIEQGSLLFHNLFFTSKSDCARQETVAALFFRIVDHLLKSDEAKNALLQFRENLGKSGYRLCAVPTSVMEQDDRAIVSFHLFLILVAI